MHKWLPVHKCLINRFLLLMCIKESYLRIEYKKKSSKRPIFITRVILLLVLFQIKVLCYRFQNWRVWVVWSLFSQWLLLCVWLAFCFSHKVPTILFTEKERVIYKNKIPLKETSIKGKKMGKEESIVRYLFTWAWNQHKCETEAGETKQSVLCERRHQCKDTSIDFK